MEILFFKSYKILTYDYKSLLNKAYVKCAKYFTCYFNVKKVIKTKSKSIFTIWPYFEKKKGDEILNWNQSSRAIFNFVELLTIGPCARAYWEKRNENKSGRGFKSDQITKYRIGTIIRKSPIIF